MPRAAAAVLTVDLGTSTTKAALWRGAELVALARAPVPTSHPAPGRAEQDPDDWWRSVERACTELHDVAPHDLALVRVIGFSAARETFALYDAALRPLTPGILWSDQRATEEAAALGDPEEFRTATGVAGTAPRRRPSSPGWPATIPTRSSGRDGSSTLATW